MLKILIRATALASAVAIGCASVPALADGTAGAMATSVVPGANTAIKNAMDAAAQKRQQAQNELLTPPGSTVAQAPPVSQTTVGGSKNKGLPVGFTYQADFSVAYPFGNLGSFGKQWLPGGMDLLAAWGFSPTTRVVASMYQIQHYPVGFNSGTVPVYLNGYQNPVGCADLGGGHANGCSPIPSQINVATKDTFGVFMLEQLFPIKIGSRVLPIVVTPTYVVRTAFIGASQNGDDVIPFSTRPPNATIETNIKTRSAEIKSIALTVPFLKTNRMFGTFTLAPSWLVQTNGLNQGNSAQLYQILYLEYSPTKHTTFFIEPQSSRDYLPPDPYPQHLFAYFLGVEQRVTKQTFVEATLNSGGPTNYSPYGVAALYCATITRCAPYVGGLKATQLQLSFGIGSPSVIPF
ncbi:MAG: hypothetical protein ACLQPV_10620 [Vulcanimicrobiaceae bacterium]